jgi:hypothetical protein
MNIKSGITAAGESVLQIDLSPVPSEVGDDDGQYLPMMTDDEVDIAWEKMAAMKWRGRLTREQFEAKQQFARMLTTRLNPQMLGINLLETSDLLQGAIRTASDIIEDVKSTRMDKLNAIEAMNLASRSQAYVTELLAKLYKGAKAREALVKEYKTRGPSSESPLVVAKTANIMMPENAKNGGE